MNGAPHPVIPPGFAAPARPASRQPPAQPRSGAWLACATTALAVLAAAAAVVSWDAQYVMVASARPVPVIAALEAGIPDAGAAVFAALGIALAMHGRRALRPRALNLACVAISVTMNALAAAPGWRGTAIWVMPAAVYAIASDSLISVVRARALDAGRGLAPDDATPLAIAGACLLWLLRLAVAPASTLTGLRRWVITACPAAPRTATPPEIAPAQPVPPARRPAANGKPRKQDLLIALAGQRHDLRILPLSHAAAIAASISGEIGLHPGTARRVLRAHVQALQNHASVPSP